MRTDAPAGFDLDAFFQGIYLFHKWEIFPGFVTDGPKDVVATMEQMRFPDDLTGKRVLDIAPWNGFFTFECARRGAAEVVALGPEDPSATGFEQVRALLELDNVRHVQGSVYDLTPEAFGEFDIVLFLGLIYHLRHPLLALDRIHDICKHDLFCDTPFIDNIVFDQTVTEDTKQALLTTGKVMHELPLLYFTKGSETGDAFNWFMPNLKCFRDLVASSGFDVTHQVDDGGCWTWIAATKAQRGFVVGYEGHNPGAAGMPRH